MALLLLLKLSLYTDVFVYKSETPLVVSFKKIIFKKETTTKRERERDLNSILKLVVCAQQEESLKLTTNNKLHICRDELLAEWALH